MNWIKINASANQSESETAIRVFQVNFEELKRQLPSKQRSIVDLARFVQTRTDDNANYNLLLGAGCSINSGVHSANELVRVWRKEILASINGGEALLKKSS